MVSDRKENGRRKAQTHATMVCLTPSLMARLDAVAERQVTSRSLLIRQACEAFLRQHEQENKT